MTTLKGRTAIITGAGRGLGRSHALRFAELGAAVVVNDMPGESGESPAQAVVDEITAAGGEAVAHEGSASNWEAAADMVQLAVNTFGSLDVLVNNAGILRDRTIVQMSEAEWDSVVDVHLKGHFCPLRHAAAYWRERTKAGEQVRASVINTSSGSGLRGNPGQVNYASAKSGIAMMTLVASRELGRYGVRVNAIAPVARTRLTLQTPGWAEKLATPETGFDKWAPENVTPLVSWLAQEDCHVSGQVFGVMGGHIGWQQGWTEHEAFDLDRAWTEDELQEALAKLPDSAPDFATSV